MKTPITKFSSDQILKEATEVGNAIFQSTWQENFKKDFFDILFWKVSERFGKYDTRYKSCLGIQNERPNLIHEHVIPRATLWELAKKGVPIADVFKYCEACIITRDEHKILHHVTKKTWSWRRYIEAGIEILDTHTNTPVPIEKLREMAEISRAALFGWM